jgi:ABC-type multidrug transport system fused ATPase/permease subunit
LIDDPLSAVDAHVGDHLFHKGICETLKEKTVILVTHQVHLLDECDRIVVLRDGQIFMQGSPNEIAAAGINFKEMLVEEAAPANEQTVEVLTPEVMDTGMRTRTVSSDQPIDTEQQLRAQELKVESGKKFMTVEEKYGGKVANEVYFWYFQMGGYALLLLAILVSLGGAGSYSYSSFYLSHWGKAAYRNAMSGHPLSTTENVNYVSRYGLLSSMAIVSSTIRSMIFVVMGVKASKQMHSLLLRGVVSSPVAHFDTTPIGRILNRFTTDLTIADETIATNMAFVLSMVSSIFGVIGSIAYTTKGMILTLFGPLLILYYFVQLYFRRTNTELKRLENITRSPIYSEFNQALAGVKSLRCYQLQDFFIHRMEGYVDTNSGIWLIQQLIKWWLTLRLETMGGMISFFVAALAAGETLFIEKQYVSLSLQAAFSLVSTVKYLVLIGSEVEANMNSVERIKHYSESIASEETPTITSRYLPKEETHEKGEAVVDTEERREGDGQQLLPQEIPMNWPEYGAISFKKVSMSYHGGPLVLKGVSFDILPCEKIGIAGRTGCGKSSLMVALYRFENLQGGSIEIDGIDISRVPLETLRSRIGIIPQEPVIFSVTIRFNLDPFDSFSDEELWSVLECVHMKETILSLPNGLLEAVSEGGENFSVGQRQLLCIARLLLRKPKVLVMDESTSSIDNETDALIQKMIRNKFDECTVLTIAHRLHTVIDSDRILVMDQGRVCQFENPKELTQRDGLFADLWARHVTSHSSKRLGGV